VSGAKRLYPKGETKKRALWAKKGTVREKKESSKLGESVGEKKENDQEKGGGCIATGQKSPGGLG